MNVLLLSLQKHILMYISDAALKIIYGLFFIGFVFLAIVLTERKKNKEITKKRLEERRMPIYRALLSHNSNLEKQFLSFEKDKYIQIFHEDPPKDLFRSAFYDLYHVVGMPSLFELLQMFFTKSRIKEAEDYLKSESIHWEMYETALRNAGLDDLKNGGLL